MFRRSNRGGGGGYYEGEQILRKLSIFCIEKFMNVEIATNFELVKFIKTHIQSIS